MYKYTHFIPENIAPAGAEKIGIYNGAGEKVCDIPLGNLTPPKATKLYSFGAISDVHITYDTANTDFQRALTYVENSDCVFTCICGDLTDNGTATQLAQYKSLVNTYAKTKPVYAIAGNHENYSYYQNTYDIADYTGHPLYYTFEYGNDVYIMCGCYAWYEGNTQLKGQVFTKDYLQWLYETLETNRNKRCFVFTHVFPYKDGVGNANGVYKLDLWTSNYGTVFESLMKHYKNTVLFHGHSHLKFALQEVDEKANYAPAVGERAVGYRSVHIPSLAVPRDIVSGDGYTTLYAESEGYIVDVYDGYIILNGRDFIDNDADGHWLPIATYKIDTTLQTIPANTFTDSTGTIVT